MPGPLAGAAITAGGSALIDLLINLVGRKSGRKATGAVLKNLFGKQLPAGALDSGKRRVGKSLRSAGKFGAVFGGLELALAGLGEPEEQAQLAAQFSNPTIPFESQELIQLEQLLASIVADDERETGGGVAGDGLFL